MTDMPPALPEPATVPGQSHAEDLPVSGRVPVTLAAAARTLGLPERSLRRWAKAGTLAGKLPAGWEVTSEKGRTTILAPRETVDMPASGPSHDGALPVTGQGEGWLREEIATLRARVDELTAELAGAVGREASLHDQVGNLKEQIAGLVASETGLTAQLVDVRGERDNLRERMAAAEREREGLIQRIPLALPPPRGFWQRIMGRRPDDGRESDREA